MKKITVILPTYNEKENICEMINILEKNIFPQIQNYLMSILVVDDNSPDGTAQLVRNYMDKYKNLEVTIGEKKGLGIAYKRGATYAMNNMNADLVIKMDSDFQHNPKYIIDLIKKCDEGYDYVIGSRFCKGGLVPKDLGLYRRFLSKYGGLCARVILFYPKTNIVSDVSSGLTLANVNNVLSKVDFSKVSSGFYYATQMLYQVVKLGIEVGEIPIELGVRTKGKTKMPFSNIPKTFITMIALRLSNIKLKRK
jgi:dolichol-phosphate mannosyltransferase